MSGGQLITLVSSSRLDLKEFISAISSGNRVYRAAIVSRLYMTISDQSRFFFIAPAPFCR